jgi:hypothetical protein
MKALAWITLLLFHPVSASELKCTLIPSSVPSCTVQLCLLPGVETYPRSSILIAPMMSLNTPLKLRVHFHGWTQESDGTPRNSNYDFAWPHSEIEPNLSDAMKMVSAFGLDQASCGLAPETILVPLSRGHDDDYKKYFISPENFESYLNPMLKILLSTQTRLSEISLSAHSGGGKILSQSLNLNDSRIRNIKLYDATYDQSTVDTMNHWIQNHDPSTSRILEIYSVTPGTRTYSRLITLEGTHSTSGQTIYTQSLNSKLLNEIRTDNQFDHYTLVKARWISSEWNKP